MIARRLRDLVLEDGGCSAREWGNGIRMTGWVLRILTFTKVIKQALGNLALVVRATWGFGGFELQVGSLETSRLNKRWAPSAGRRDVEADVEGDGEDELRDRRR